MTTLLDLSNNILLTFQAVSDFIKALIIVVPPAFSLGVYALTIWSRSLRAKHDPRGPMIYSMHRNEDGTMSGYKHNQPLALFKGREVDDGTITFKLVRHAQEMPKEFAEDTKE